MLNQIMITQSLIDNINKISHMAELGVSYMTTECSKMEETQVKHICLETCENTSLAIAAIKDFVYRATHDSYGEKL